MRVDNLIALALNRNDNRISAIKIVRGGDSFEFEDLNGPSRKDLGLSNLVSRV